MEPTQPQAPQSPPQGQQYTPPAVEQSPPKTDSYPEPSQDQKLHPMVVLQPGERIVANVKRHPFGILSMYAGAGVAVVVVIALAIFLPTQFDQYSDSSSAPIYIGAGIFLVGLLLMLWIATTVYWQNEWVVTTDSITQISQRSLFNRQVSQLSMDNLEDVTVDQNGLLPSMFNFGTLKVETAGERSKFTFPYCPNPNECARRILQVHEDFLEMRRNVGRGGVDPQP